MWPYLYNLIFIHNANVEVSQEEIQSNESDYQVLDDKEIDEKLEQQEDYAEDMHEIYEDETDIYLWDMLLADEEMSIILDKMAKLAFTVADGNLSANGYRHYMYEEILPEMEHIRNMVYTAYAPGELSVAHEHFIDVVEYYYVAMQESIISVTSGENAAMSRYNDLLSQARKSQRLYALEVAPYYHERGMNVLDETDYNDFQYTFVEPYTNQGQPSNTIKIEIEHKFIHEYQPVQRYQGGGTFNLPPGIKVPSKPVHY